VRRETADDSRSRLRRAQRSKNHGCDRGGDATKPNQCRHAIWVPSDGFLTIFERRHAF
jgi:hypothetical protein